MFAVPPGFTAKRSGTPVVVASMWGVGYSDRGQIHGEAEYYFDPTPVYSGIDFSKVKSVIGQNCHVIKTDGTLWGWGQNLAGQVGDGTTIAKSSPVQLGTQSNWSMVATGGLYSMAIDAAGKLYGWGSQTNGVLGTGSSSGARSVIFQIGTLTNWAQVSAGRSHTSAVKTDGTLWSWGDNQVGALGDGTIIAKNSPVQIGLLTDWRQVSVGDLFAMATKSDGTLWGWGFGSGGRLGNGATGNISSPVQIGTLTDWLSVECNISGAVAIKSNGTVWTWGGGLQGQLGDSTTVAKSSPVQVGTLSWAYASTGMDNSNTTSNIIDYGIQGGHLYSWGSNAANALGISSTATLMSSPVQIGTRTDWAWAHQGAGPSYFGDTSGNLFAVGKNIELCMLRDFRKSNVTQLSSTTWSKISVGQKHAVAIKSDGSMWTWGDNQSFQLAAAKITNTVDFRMNAIQIGSGQSWAYCYAGSDNTFAVRADNTLWVCGSNIGSPLGDGTAAVKSVLTQIGSLTNWKTVVSSRDSNPSTFAIKTDGTLWAWGSATGGKFGDGTAVSKSVPTQIGTLTDWATVATDQATTIAVKSDGTLWSWGSASNGARGAVGSVSSPVQVGTAVNWAKVDLNWQTTGAVTTDGKLFMWGLGTSGQIGDGTIITKSVPTQIGTLTTWADVKVGLSSIYALKTDGTVWAWGSNSVGQLGNGTLTNTSSPIQIGTHTDWVAITAGGYAAGTYTGATMLGIRHE